MTTYLKIGRSIFSVSVRHNTYITVTRSVLLEETTVAMSCSGDLAPPLDLTQCLAEKVINMMLNQIKYLGFFFLNLSV